MSGVERKYENPGPFADVVYDNGVDGPCDPHTPSGQDFTIVYPAAVGVLRKHPVITWGRGLNFKSVADPMCTYRPMLEHLASWGFVVICRSSCEEQEMGNGSAVLGALNEMLRLNENPESIFCNSLDTSKIAAVGHSLGALGVLNAAVRSPGLITTVMAIGTPDDWLCQLFSSCVDTSLMKVPVFFVRGNDSSAEWDNLGEDWISPEPRNKSIYDPVPGAAAKATALGGKHLNMAAAVGYMTAWLFYTLDLPGAEAARGVFTGNPPEIVDNPEWDNWAAKNLP